MELMVADETEELAPGQLVQRARAMALRLQAVLEAAHVRPSDATADALKDGVWARALANLAVRAAEAAEAVASEAALSQLQAAFARCFAAQPGRVCMQRVARTALLRATDAAVACRGDGEKPPSPEDLALASALAAARSAAMEALADVATVQRAETGELQAGDAGDVFGAKERWAEALIAGVRCKKAIRNARRALPAAERDAAVALFAAGWRRPQRRLGPNTLSALQDALERSETTLESVVMSVRLAAKAVVEAVEEAARPRAWALYAHWRPTDTTPESHAPIHASTPSTSGSGFGSRPGETTETGEALESDVEATSTDSDGAKRRLSAADVFVGAGDRNGASDTLDSKKDCPRMRTRRVKSVSSGGVPRPVRYPSHTSRHVGRPRRGIARSDRKRRLATLRNAWKGGSVGDGACADVNVSWNSRQMLGGNCETS